MRHVDKLFVAMKAFIRYEGKILLLQENDTYPDGTNQGKWELPGGRIESGEEFKEGLLREVKEETGLKVTIERPFMVGEWWPQVRGEQWHIVATFFVCNAETDVVQLGPDHGAYQWLDPDDYSSVTNFAPSIKKAFETYLNLEQPG